MSLICMDKFKTECKNYSMYKTKVPYIRKLYFSYLLEASIHSITIKKSIDFMLKCFIHKIYNTLQFKYFSYKKIADI